MSNIKMNLAQIQLFFGSKSASTIDMDQIEQVFVDQMLNTYFEQLIMFFCIGIEEALFLIFGDIVS